MAISAQILVEEVLSFEMSTQTSNWTSIKFRNEEKVRQPQILTSRSRSSIIMPMYSITVSHCPYALYPITHVPHTPCGPHCLCAPYPCTLLPLWVSLPCALYPCIPLPPVSPLPIGPFAHVTHTPCTILPSLPMWPIGQWRQE